MKKPGRCSGFFFSNAPPLVMFCMEIVPKGWLKSVGVFSPTRRAGRYEGGEGTTVVGEKPPTSPSFGSGWHANFIRVKGK